MSAEYVKEYFEDGFICPYCGESSVEATSEPENHGSSITMNVECTDCDKEWKEEYHLMGTRKIDKFETIFTKTKLIKQSGELTPEIIKKLNNLQNTYTYETKDRFYEELNQLLEWFNKLQ